MSQQSRVDAGKLRAWALDKLKDVPSLKTRNSAAYFFGRLAIVFVAHGYLDGTIRTGRTRSAVIKYLESLEGSARINRKRAYRFFAYFMQCGLIEPQDELRLNVPEDLVWREDASDFGLTVFMREAKAAYADSTATLLMRYGRTVALAYLALAGKSKEERLAVNDVADGLSDDDAETMDEAGAEHEHLENQLKARWEKRRRRAKRPSTAIHE